MNTAKDVLDLEERISLEMRHALVFVAALTAQDISGLQASTDAFHGIYVIDVYISGVYRDSILACPERGYGFYPLRELSDDDKPEVWETDVVSALRFFKERHNIS